MSMKNAIVWAVLAAVGSTPAFATKPCDELKSEIGAKLAEKKVGGYKLDVVEADQAGDRRVVGSCEGGKKKIVYEKSPAK